MKEAEHTVKVTANKLYRRWPPVRMIGTLEDVEQIGRLGALSAIERFDPARGIRFATFATLRIKGQIFDAAREAALVRIPRSATQRNEEIKIAQTIGDFRVGRGVGHSAREGWLSEIEPRHEPRGLSDADAALARWLTSLDKQGRLIVSLYFGLDGQAAMTMRQIGRSLGLSESRVSQRMTALLADARERPFLKLFARAQT